MTGGKALNEAGQSFAASVGTRVAAVICRTEHGNLHAGLFFRTGEGQTAALHLGWQDQLYCQWTDGGFWAAPKAEPELLSAVATFCRRIWRTYAAGNKRFPYAFRFNDTTFDATGRLVLGPDANGLTCATFVLVIFREGGIDLLAEVSWPLRIEEDLHFVECLRGFAGDAHCALLRSEIESGCKRIRPDEVVGACTLADLPATFEPVAEAAQRVLDRLDGTGGGSPPSPAATPTDQGPAATSS